MTRSRKLRSDVITEQMHVRLLNWGRWLRLDTGTMKHGYPTQCPFVFSPRRGTMIAELDAEHIEWIISSFAVSNITELQMISFVLKVEYADRAEAYIGPVKERAKDVQRRWKVPCGLTTYHEFLRKGRIAVTMFADPLQE